MVQDNNNVEPMERDSERTLMRSHVRLELASWKEEAGNKKEAASFSLYISYMINDEIFIIGSEIKQWVQLFSRNPFICPQKFLKDLRFLT